jgi:hypothetical protein
MFIRKQKNSNYIFSVSFVMNAEIRNSDAALEI